VINTSPQCWVIKGWRRACWVVIRCRGSKIKSLRIKSLAISVRGI
jgi:hypothetical protein